MILLFGTLTKDILLQLIENTGTKEVRLIGIFNYVNYNLILLPIVGTKKDKDLFILDYCVSFNVLKCFLKFRENYA